MAQLEALNVQLLADVKGLTGNLKVGEDGLIKFAKTVDELEKDLKNFKDALKKASDPADILKLNKSIEETGAKIKAVKGFGSFVPKELAPEIKKVTQETEKFSKGSGAATQATINLGRVLQDAPYGFIGIANNLNPLLESFQRLGKDSGGLKGAFSGLASSMLGAGGIGLALSAFQFFALGGVDAIKKMFGALGDNKAVAEARKEIDEFNKSLKGAESGALATGLKLQSFVDIAKNGALPLSQRNEALKEANKILGEHGTKLTLANVATEAITKQTKLYTEALIAQAVAAKFADRIADLTVKQATQTKERVKGIQELTKAEKDYQKSKNSNVLRDQTGAETGDIGKLLNLNSARKKVLEARQLGTSLTIQISNLKQLFDESTNAATKSFGALGTNKDDKTGGTAKKIQSEADKIAEIVKKLYADIDGLKATKKEGLLSNLELDNKTIDAYKNAIQNIGEINPKETIIPKLGLEVNPVVIRNLFAEESIRLSKEKPYEVEVPVAVKSVANGQSGFDFSEALAAGIKKAGETVSASMQPFRDIVFQTVADSFAGIGDAISNAVVGGGNFAASLFSGLFQTLGSGLQAYGKQVIVFSKLMIGLKKALDASSFGGSLILGIGLVALGGVVKGLGAGLKLADGGFVSGKGTSRSDSIPAMLSNGEYVINAAAVRKFGLNNLDKINSLQGFAAGGVIGVPQPYAVPNNNVNISNSGIVVAIEGEFKMRNDVLALAVKKGNKTVSINS
jgi:hypothetical protein